MTFESLTADTIDFVRQHQAWAAPIAGALAFGESLAVLSLIIPATVILLAIGAMAGATGLDFWPLWLAAAIGASLGDWLSYEVGRWLGKRAHGIWPLSRYPEMIAKGEAFVQRFGIWGIFLGRFFGPARAMVPLVAGIFEMRRLPFQAANVASAVIWAFVLLAPGFGLLEWLRT